MGYSNNGKNFWPDNTETHLYLSGERCFHEVYQRVREHFKIPFDPDLFSIYAERVQTSCIGYDLYDGSHYTDFIVIEKTGSY